jgi:hypothetical protein
MVFTLLKIYSKKNKLCIILKIVERKQELSRVLSSDFIVSSIDDSTRQNDNQFHSTTLVNISISTDLQTSQIRILSSRAF